MAPVGSHDARLLIQYGPDGLTVDVVRSAGIEINEPPDEDAPGMYL